MMFSRASLLGMLAGGNWTFSSVVFVIFVKCISIIPPDLEKTFFFNSEILGMHIWREKISKLRQI